MTKPLTFYLTDLSCASCVGRVETALRAVDGVSAVHVNLADQSVQFGAQDPVAIGEALATLETKGYPATLSPQHLTVDGLSCASCVARVTAILQDQPGLADVQVNLADHSAVVQAAHPTFAIRAAKTLTDKGYPAEFVNETTNPLPDEDTTIAQLKRQTLIAAALTLPVFVLEMGGHMVPAFHHFIGRSIGFQASWYIQFLLTSAVLLGPGRVFLQKGIPALLRGAPDMNALVAMGTLAAWGFSTVATFAPSLLPADSRHVYFEAAAVIVTLILLGRTLEARAKGRSGAAIRRLLGLRPDTATVVRDGADMNVALSELKPGDILRIRPGARLPADGQVAEGESFIDESMLTGEPMPVLKSPGDSVTGGTVNAQGGLLVRVTSVGADTALSRIIEMVRQAQSSQPPIQSLVNRITGWFVPAVLAIALLTFFGWLILGPSPALNHALVAAVAVLIIACPCAMGLATPMSIMVGSGRAADLGVLFRKGDALQSLGDVRIVAFDKTGTLTQGQPELTQIDVVQGWNKNDVLRYLASAEAGSEHPIAKAIMRAAGPEPLQEVSGFEALAGLGLQANVAGKQVIIGKRRLFEKSGLDISRIDRLPAGATMAGQTVFYGAIAGEIVARLSVSDPIKPKAVTAVERLKAMGLEVALISGDSLEASTAVARKLGIDHVAADVMPDGKVTALKDLRKQFGPLGFVGDGINDAPALAAADVGLAIGSGTDVAIEAADVVLMGGDPNGVADAIEISLKTMGNIRQNLVWAFGYNALLIPAAALGMLSPALAAGAMAFSSVFVVLNALRLNRYKRGSSKQEPATSPKAKQLEKPQEALL